MARLAVLLDNWNPHGGGLEQYLLHVLPEVAAKGHDVLLVAADASQRPPANCEAKNLSHGKFLPRPLREYINQKQASRIVDTWQPDTVLTMRSLGYPGSIHMPIGGSPRHIPRFNKISRRTQKLIELEESAMNSASMLLPNSQFVAEQLTEYMPNVIQQIVPLPLFESPQSRKPQLEYDSNEALRLVHCGRDSHRHGLIEAYHWFSAIKTMRPSSTLDCFGKSVKHLCRALNKTEDELGAEGITTHSWQNDFRQDLHKFDLLLHPSRYDSFSLVCLEAAASAVPVLCSHSVGVASQLPDNICTALNSDSVNNEVVAAVESLLQHQQQQSSQLIANEFSLDKHLQMLLGILF